MQSGHTPEDLSFSLANKQILNRYPVEGDNRLSSESHSEERARPPWSIGTENDLSLDLSNIQIVRLYDSWIENILFL